MARSVESFRRTQTEQAAHAGPTARGLAVAVGEVRSQHLRSLQKMNRSQLARPRPGREGRVFGGVGGIARHSGRKCPG